MAEPVSIRQALDLRPEDALRAFRARDELKLSVSYRDLAPEEHARAFTVAKIAKTDLLADIGGSLDRALKEGQSFETWKADILPTLQRHGWWGVVTDETLTGTSRRVFVGDRRLRTIFQTNMRVSHAAGQWARIQQLKATRPFLRYVGILDQRIRPEHAAWHGIILPVDHPFWRSHYPPNGWNCRCQVLQLSQRDLDRRGWKVTTEDELARIAPMVPIDESGFGAPDAGGHRPQRAVRPGVDAGWDYHVGAESLRGLTEKAVQSLDRIAKTDLEGAGRTILHELLDSPAIEQFLADDRPALPVAIISPAKAAMLDSGQRVLTLSQRSLSKIQTERQRKYPTAVYRAIQSAVDEPLILIRQRNGNLLHVFEVDGKLYSLAMKAVPEKNELWVATLFRQSTRDLPRMRRTGEILIDHLEDGGAR